MDFNHYSILTTIIRARSAVLKSRLVCEDCLYAARKALTTLRALQEAFSSHVTSIDSYPYFLTWYAPKPKDETLRPWPLTRPLQKDNASLSPVPFLRTILQRRRNFRSPRFRNDQEDHR